MRAARRHRQYAADIEALLGMRARITRGEKTPAPGETLFRSLVGDLADTDVEPVMIESRPPLGQAVLTLMRFTPDREDSWTADDVLEGLIARSWEPGGKTPRNSVAATLSRLRRDGLVERVAPGRYALTPNGREDSG
jgi:hypothetical protein